MRVDIRNGMVRIRGDRVYVNNEARGSGLRPVEIVKSAPSHNLDALRSALSKVSVKKNNIRL